MAALYAHTHTQTLSPVLTTESKVIAEELLVQQYGNLCFCLHLVHISIPSFNSFKTHLPDERHANLYTVLTVGNTNNN